MRWISSSPTRRSLGSISTNFSRGRSRQVNGKCLLDDLVRLNKNTLRHDDVEPSRGLDIHREFKLFRQLDGEIGGLGPLLYVDDGSRGAAIEIGQNRPVRHYTDP